MPKITSFTGDFAFLSNFYEAQVIYRGIVYPTAEHAYQAQKTTDIGVQEQIRAAPTPGRAKKIGNSIALRPDWEDIRVDVMEDIIWEKFTQNEDLAQRLINTYPQELVEGNDWGDQFWGVSGGTGNNMLGQILMRARDALMEVSSAMHEMSGSGTDFILGGLEGIDPEK